jgi:DNA-binding PadR family transcriptional regulator
MGAGSAREQAQAPMHSTVNWALLGLVIERPSYAYELAMRFERTYEGALSLASVSHVYTALATLRERELIEEAPDTRAAQRSKRRYQATARGLCEHAEWLVGQVSEERRRQRLLVQQLGALARTPARALEVLDAYERACLAEAAAAPPAGGEQGPGTTRLVARLIGEETRLAIAAKLEWTQYARTQLRVLAGSSPGAAEDRSR